MDLILGPLSALGEGLTKWYFNPVNGITPLLMLIGGLILLLVFLMFLMLMTRELKKGRWLRRVFLLIGFVVVTSSIVVLLYVENALGGAFHRFIAMQLYGTITEEYNKYCVGGLFIGSMLIFIGMACSPRRARR